MPVDIASHALVLRWSHTLRWQVGRLRQQRIATVAASQDRRSGGHYSEADSHPFYELYAEVHFTISAAKHLLTALRRFDGQLRLPAGLDRKRLETLRNALEHWESPESNWGPKMKLYGADPTRHHFTLDGSGTLGDVVDDDDLLAWAEGVHAEVKALDVR